MNASDIPSIVNIMHLINTCLSNRSVSSKDALQGFHMKDMMKDYYARNFKSHSYVESTPKTIGNSGKIPAQFNFNLRQ